MADPSAAQDPSTLTDDELSEAVAAAELELAATQPGSSGHAWWERQIDALYAEAEARAATGGASDGTADDGGTSTDGA